MATRALVIAARQPEFVELLEQEGYEVESRTRPLDGESPDVDVAVVFRGRLIGRQQAETLAEAGVPVVEVLTGPAGSASKAGWIRVSSRITKPDLVQLVHALAGLAAERRDRR
jgi:hypothetical protein